MDSSSRGGTHPHKPRGAPRLRRRGRQCTYLALHGQRLFGVAEVEDEEGDVVLAGAAGIVAGEVRNFIE